VTEDTDIRNSGQEQDAEENFDELETDAIEEDVPDMESLLQELEETREQLMRVAADADNFKKRMERDKEKMLKYAGENILRELLNTVDNLDRALEQGKVEGGDPQQKLEALLAGIDLTRKGLASTLERFGVTPLESEGQPFNPDEMDALTMESSDEVPASHVLREFARGYKFKDRVLRHAQVVVSSGSEKSS
jgi:molecular chaperone GrpE